MIPNRTKDLPELRRHRPCATERVIQRSDRGGQRRGHPVFTANSDVPTSTITSFTAFGNYDAGETCANKMYEALGKQKPDVGILDEPTSALSVEATELVHETVRQLRSEGITVIIVSHSLDEIFGRADRIAVLYQGTLVDVADPSTVDRDSLVHMMSTGTRAE